MGVFSVRKTTEQFIAEAKAVHGNKYDYSKVEYKGNQVKVCIICPIHGEFWQIPKSHLRGHGCNKCYQCSKHKFNIAIYDIPNSCSTECYMAWRGVLERTIGIDYKSRFKTYKECNVCDEWLVFSVFKNWFDDPTNGYIKGYHLDKDILIKGNKVYSPDTCCFVPSEINLVFSNKSKKSNTPKGVSKNYNKYEANIYKNGESVYIGLFDTLDKAFNAYKLAKEQYIKELAEKYFQEGKITKKVYDALMRYEVEITD